MVQANLQGTANRKKKEKTEKEVGKTKYWTGPDWNSGNMSQQLNIELGGDTLLRGHLWYTSDRQGSSVTIKIKALDPELF